MRESSNQYEKGTGRLLNGFCYVNQAWVIDGRFVACGHPKPCTCYGTMHEGETTKCEGVGDKGPLNFGARD